MGQDGRSSETNQTVISIPAHLIDNVELQKLIELKPYVDWFHSARNGKQWQYPPSIRGRIYHALKMGVPHKVIADLLNIEKNTIKDWKNNRQRNFAEVDLSDSFFPIMVNFSDPNFSGWDAIRAITPLVDLFHQQNSEKKRWHYPPEVREVVFFAVHKGVNLTSIASVLRIKRETMRTWSYIR
jgi:hypothetical protein